MGECFLLFFDFFSREGDRRRFLGGDGLSLEEDEERRRTFDGLITYFGEESILGGETSLGAETRSLVAVSESFTLGLRSSERDVRSLERERRFLDGEKLPLQKRSESVKCHHRGREGVSEVSS